MKNYPSHPYLDALAEVYDDSPVPVFLTDEKLHLLYANEAAISNDRSLCSEDGILRMLGAEASAVRQALCSRDTFRLELHRPLPFYAVLFIRLYGSDGKAAAISVHPLRRNAVLREHRFFSTETLYDAVLREILTPSADALELLGKMRRGEPTPSPEECLHRLERDACRSMSAVQRICDEMGLLTRLSECDRPLLSAVSFAKSFGSRYEIPTVVLGCDGRDARILADPDTLFKILADSAVFLSFLPQTGEKKTGVKISVICDEDSVRFVLRRERVRAVDPDPFSPTVNTGGTLNINLFSARELALRSGAELSCMLPDEKHRFAEVTVRMNRAFPDGDAFDFGDGWDDFFGHVPGNFSAENALLMRLAEKR